ncbi:histone-lysine N-methyltransferase SETMAR [Trichonephila clavipes]|nr:histone-lysine N-methyltransferase SETMAR [Trichonephila clavipes]
MTKLLGSTSRLEVCALIRFLWAKNVSASDICSQIVEVDSDDAMSRQHVVKLCHSFQSGRQDAENHNMAGSGLPSSSKAEINKAGIEEMIQKNRQVTM